MFLILLAVVIGIGYLIGKVKGNQVDGAIWSAIFGPIGWLIVMMMKDQRPICPRCGARADAPKFVFCQHCGHDMRRKVQPHYIALKGDPMIEWEARERAKTVLPVPEHLKRK